MAGENARAKYEREKADLAEGKLFGEPAHAAHVKAMEEAEDRKRRGGSTPSSSAPAAEAPKAKRSRK